MPLLSPWSAAERAAWAPASPITVSQWAAKYRVLPKSAAISGAWSNRLGPYAVGVMDSFTDPRVEFITIMASVQSMKTECSYNMLGYAICEDPAPALVVMPTLELGHKANRRLRTMLRVSEELAGHLTGNPDDLRMKTITLDRMDLNFATAGSEADMQFVEARYLILDETDLYQPGTVKQAIDRTTTFWNRKVVTLSRPTIPEGHINTEYQKSDRRKFWVPCPRCGGYQVLDFWQVKHRGEERGKWPKEKRGKDYIIDRQVAVYECKYCLAEIDNREKGAMMLAGKWVSEDCHIDRDGSTDPPAPVSHVGFWWNALYSPFLTRTWSHVAAEYFSVKDSPADHRNFVNQWLAEPWKEIVQSRPASAILELRTNLPALVVPEDTLALTAGIDSQKRGFWVVIRAWVLTQDGLRASHKIRHGWVGSFGELEKWLFEDVYRTETGSIEHRIWAGLIDTGGGLMGEGEANLTEQVYNWLRRSGRGRIFGSKGSSKPLTGGRLAIRSNIDCYPSGKPLPGGLVLWRLDTNALKDFIWARIENGLFHLDGGQDPSAKEIEAHDLLYAAHLSAEVKERNTKGHLAWTVQYQRDNHLLDCEVMAAGAAEALNVWLLPRPQAASPAASAMDSEPLNPFTGRSEGDWLRS